MSSEKLMVFALTLAWIGWAKAEMRVGPKLPSWLIGIMWAVSAFALTSALLL